MINKNLVARKILDRILDDLRDRRGFRHLLESIELEDDETYQEIKDSLFKIIVDNLEENKEEKKDEV